jgi:hypothetical protein
MSSEQGDLSQRITNELDKLKINMAQLLSMSNENRRALASRISMTLRMPVDIVLHGLNRLANDFIINAPPPSMAGDSTTDAPEPD